MLITNDEYITRLKRFNLEEGCFSSSAEPRGTSCDDTSIKKLEKLFNTKYTPIVCSIPDGYKMDDYMPVDVKGDKIEGNCSVDHIVLDKKNLYFIECKEVSESISNSFLGIKSSEIKDYIDTKMNKIQEKVLDLSKESTEISKLLDKSDESFVNSSLEVGKNLSKKAESMNKVNKFTNVKEYMSLTINKIIGNINMILNEGEEVNIIPFIFFDYQVAEDTWGKKNMSLLSKWLYNQIRLSGGYILIKKSGNYEDINRRDIGIAFGRSSLPFILTNENYEGRQSELSTKEILNSMSQRTIPLTISDELTSKRHGKTLTISPINPVKVSKFIKR